MESSVERVGISSATVARRKQLYTRRNARTTVGPPPAIPNPLRGWLDGSDQSAELFVNLNTRPLNSAIPLDQQPPVVPDFDGYYTAGNDAWIIKDLLSPLEGYASTGVLSYQVRRLNTTEQIEGYYLVLLSNGNDPVRIAKDFDEPIILLSSDANFSLIIELWDLVFSIPSIGP